MVRQDQSSPKNRSAQESGAEVRDSDRTEPSTPSTNSRGCPPTENEGFPAVRS
jgi:hypothetical protein